jgi:hypothetical protein
MLDIIIPLANFDQSKKRRLRVLFRKRKIIDLPNLEKIEWL